MKILMLSWEFPPRIIGGIATHVYNLSRALVRRGIAVTVITCDFPSAKLEDTVDGVQVCRVDSGRISQTNFLLWTYYLNSLMIGRGSEILNKDPFDLIHAHDWLVARAALELKKRYGIPVLTTVHATEMGRGNGLLNDYQKTIHSIEDLLIRNSERVICCSKFMHDHLQQKFDVPAQKLDLIPNAVDVTRFNSSKEPEDSSNSGTGDKAPYGKVVLYVGRIVAEKGLSTLIEAFAKLRQDKFNASLVIVGEGPIKERLENETRKRGLDTCINFTGLVDEPSLVKLYRSSDVFVLPSLYEPFGIAALEAMASLLPVVVSDTGGLSEIVENDVTGVKVPVNDPDSLSAALRRLLEDAPFAERLKKNAYSSLLEKYDWGLVAERTSLAYERTRAETRLTPTLPEENFLTDGGVLTLLFTLGATRKDIAKTAHEIAGSVHAPEAPVKLILGRLASQGYVTSEFEPESALKVAYHLTENGIVKACAGFS